MANVNKIHVNSSTNMSLNDRFTVISTIDPKPTFKNNVRQNSSGLAGESFNNISSIAKSSIANRILLQQLSRKHHIIAALKLKRRSLKSNMRNFRSRGPRGTSNQTAENNLRSNSVTNIATMRSGIRHRSVLPSNSAMNQSLRRRITGRQLAKMRGNNRIIQNKKSLLKNRGNASKNLPIINQNLRQVQRSSSIGRNPILHSNSKIGTLRSRSRSRSNIRMHRSQNSTSERRRNSRARGRSASRSREEIPPITTSRSSIISRLGVNPASNHLRRQNRIYLAEGGIDSGTSVNRPRGRSRARGRSHALNKIDSGNLRSVSRNRNYLVNGNKRFNTKYMISQNQYRSRGRIGRGPKGRSKFDNSTHIETTHRRGRSRDRGRNNRSSSRHRGLNKKNSDVSKADLDKELDQYMANNEI